MLLLFELGLWSQAFAAGLHNSFPLIRRGCAVDGSFVVVGVESLATTA